MVSFRITFASLCLPAVSGDDRPLSPRDNHQIATARRLTRIPQFPAPTKKHFLESVTGMQHARHDLSPIWDPTRDHCGAQVPSTMHAEATKNASRKNEAYKTNAMMRTNRPPGFGPHDIPLQGGPNDAARMLSPGIGGSLVRRNKARVFPGHRPGSRTPVA